MFLFKYCMIIRLTGSAFAFINERYIKTFAFIFVAVKW